MPHHRRIEDHVLLALVCIVFVCGLVLVGTTKGEWIILEISSTGDVQNGPSADSIFTLSQTYTISHIRTYHWNFGQGSMPGNIRIRDQSGNWFGPWSAYGESGMGVANAYWNAYPGIALPPGTYTIEDSDRSTWSCNSDTGWRGFTGVWTQ
jgi:hypothetical protein